jgi:hypothetical protein
VATIPALEYYLFSIVGWLLFGFLSHIGDFYLLGIHIKFSGYFFLVFVVIFYGCLFFMGHHALKLVRKEYKVGRASLTSKEDIRLRVNKAKLLNVASRLGKMKMNAKKFNLSSILPDASKDDVDEEKVDDDNSRVIVETPPAAERNTVGKIFALFDDRASEDDSEDADEVELEKEIENREQARLQMVNAIDSSDSGDEKEDEDRAADLPVINTEKVDIDNVRKLEQEQYRLLVALTAYDSSDSDDKREREREKEKLREAKEMGRRVFKSLRLLIEESDSDEDPDYSEKGGKKRNKIDVLEVLRASNYLESKGIYLEKNSAASEYLTIAKAVMHMDNDIDSEGVKRGGSDHGSGSDCDSDSSDDITEAEVLDAFRYLSVKGISLDDDTDVSQYVKVMRAIMLSEAASAKKYEEEIEQGVETFNKFVRYSSDSSDD